MQRVSEKHEFHRSAVAGKDLSGINVQLYLVQGDRARRVGDYDMVAVSLHFNALNARIWQRLAWNTSTQRVALIQRGHAGWEESESYRNIARKHINSFLRMRISAAVLDDKEETPPSWAGRFQKRAEARCLSTARPMDVKIGVLLQTGPEGLLFTSKIEPYYWLYFVSRIYCPAFLSTSQNRQQNIWLE